MLAQRSGHESCQAVEAIIRHHSQTFAFATRLLPPAERRAIRALYAFCRTTDDLVDGQPVTRADVEAWRARARLPAGAQTDPVLACWAEISAHYQVDLRYQDDLIDGVAMDLEQTTYATWEDLQLYCYRVASTVGLLAMPILGFAPGASFGQAAPYAIKLGLALQLTNILRDVGEDAARGRIYLPQSDLARFGLCSADILNRVTDARLVALLQFEIARARALYREALPGVALLRRSGRLAVGAAALLYRAILREIERLDYRVFERRAYTSTWRKVQLLPGIWFTLLRLARPARPVTNDLPGLRTVLSSLEQSQ